LLAPAAARPALWALLAFNYEIARVREVVSQPIMGQIRLQWWREALDDIVAGRPPRQHYVVGPLAAAITRHHIPRALLDQMIDGRERDLDDTPPATLEDLETYAEATSARLLQAELRVLGAHGEASHDAARRVGIAWALVGLIRALPFHRRQGRVYVPAALVAAEAVLADPGQQAVRAALQMMATRAADQLAAARLPRARIPPEALPALLIARVASVYLNDLLACGFDVSRSVVQPRPLASMRLWWGSVIRRF